MTAPEDLQPAQQHLFLHLGDSLSDLDITRASLSAIVNRPAAPHPIRSRQNAQAILAGLVAAVEDETMSLHNSRRPYILTFDPK